MAKKEYKTFRELLVKGIGDRTQIEFANACGISKEHLSRMLNQPFIGQPTRGVLKKMAANMEGVTLAELMQACDYKDEAAILTETDTALNEKQKRMKMSWEERVKLNIADLKKGFSTDMISMKNLVLWDDVESAVKAFHMLYSVEDLLYSYTNSGDYTGGKYNGAEKYVVIDVKFQSETLRNTTTFVLFYIETASGKVIITDAAFNGASLLEVDAISEQKIKELRKYGIDVEKIPYLTATRNIGIEDRLLKAIFGGCGEEMDNLMIGYGFYLEKIPDAFKKFIINHSKTFCQTDAEKSIYEKLTTASTDEAESLFGEYTDERTRTSGYGAAISNIMSRETGYAFEWYRDEYNNFSDNPPCVICDTDYMEEKDRHAVQRIVYDYAKELHLEQVSECYFKFKMTKDLNSIVKIEYDEE